MITLLNKSLSICHSGWREIRNALLVIGWVCWALVRREYWTMFCSCSHRSFPKQKMVTERNWLRGGELPEETRRKKNVNRLVKLRGLLSPSTDHISFNKFLYFFKYCNRLFNSHRFSLSFSSPGWKLVLSMSDYWANKLPILYTRAFPHPCLSKWSLQYC